MKHQLHKHARALAEALPRRVSVYAANASFFIILSLFPALLILLCLVKYLPFTAQDLTDLLDSWLPTAVQPLVDLAAGELYSQSYDLALISGAVLVAIWSAARGVLGILDGLNEMYRVTDRRNYVLRRLLSALYTLALGAAILITLGLHLMGGRLFSLLAGWAPVLAAVLDALTQIRYLVLVPMLTAVFTVVFLVLPDRRSTLRQELPGAFLAALVWEGFSELFSLYVSSTAGYSRMYGSLVTVAVAMLWLFFCMSILFYGAALNHWLTARKEKRGQ